MKELGRAEMANGHGKEGGSPLSTSHYAELFDGLERHTKI
jgi:hypothetical protein